jgi:uncharacterized membrane protein HdeD (DUF308 family)
MRRVGLRASIIEPVRRARDPGEDDMSTDALSGDNTDPSYTAAVPRPVADLWWLPLLLGIVNIVVGALVIFWPDETVVVLAVLFGIQLLIVGCIRIAQSILSPEASAAMRVVNAVIGVLSVLVGVLCLRHITQTIAVLVLLVGLLWLISGMLELIGALSSGPPTRWTSETAWDLVTGVIAVLAGITVLAYPGITVTALAFLLGIWLVVYGVVAVLAALRLRSATTA